MRIISHRGNISGKNPALENNPDYIREAIDQGYEVEIDIWLLNEQYYFGHDNPQYNVQKHFINRIKNKSWFHCKNHEALVGLKKDFDDINFFWHEKDKYTITSKGYIWAYPGEKVLDNSIFLFPENYPEEKDKIILSDGICTDYPAHYETYKNIEKIQHSEEEILLKLKNPTYSFFTNGPFHFENPIELIDPQMEIDSNVIYKHRIFPVVVDFDANSNQIFEENVFIFPLSARYYHNLTEIFPRLLKLKKIDPDFVFVIAAWIDPEWIYSMSTCLDPNNREYYFDYLFEFLNIFNIKYKFFYKQDFNRNAFRNSYIFYEKRLINQDFQNLLEEGWHEKLKIYDYQHAGLYFMVNHHCVVNQLKYLSNYINSCSEQLQLKQTSDSYPKKIFISRKNFLGRKGDGYISEENKLIEKKLEQIFIDSGFVIINMEDYSFLEQMKLSHNAEIIACFIGSSTFNTCYSNFEKKLFYLNPLNLEFNSETHLRESYSNILKLLEVDQTIYDIDMFDINTTELKEVLSSL